MNMLKIRTVLGLSLLLFSAAATKAGELTLYDPVQHEKGAIKVRCRGIDWRINNREFQFQNKPNEQWPSLLIDGNWSLRDYSAIELRLKNYGNKKVKVLCRLDSPGADAAKGFRTLCPNIDLEPNESKTWVFAIPQLLPPQLEGKMTGMRGYPGGAQGKTDGTIIGPNDFNPAELVKVTVFLMNPKEKFSIGIKSIKATTHLEYPIASKNDALKLPSEKFFPMIDRYGQYKHADWPGKIKSENGLKKNADIESAELKKHVGPKGWNQFGGWAEGPRRKATGHFHVEKINGVWWMVDPEGCLFWSHGPNCVHYGVTKTKLKKREHYFEAFPFDSARKEEKAFWSGARDDKRYNFMASNLRLKYGGQWEKIWMDLAHVRLKSWGMNTVGNWSMPAVYTSEKTPYTETMPIDGPEIAGCTGFWRAFRDPFHPDFRKNVAKRCRMIEERANSPWCIGIFVDNEINWGNDDLFFAVGALKSPANQPAKIKLVEMLKRKYGRIEKLNEAWGSRYADWETTLQSTEVPDRAKAADDLKAFYNTVGEEYFSVIKEELRKVAPNTMYLGCRFAYTNDAATRIAARYCDVVSFNRYLRTLDGFQMPDGIDRPMIVGEFHFGALDRGMFHPGLQRATDQDNRAELYAAYVLSALRHPQIVGAHWFQYTEQAATGREQDGENYQVGLVDICDTPYPETINAIRRVGYSLYKQRSELSR